MGREPMLEYSGWVYHLIQRGNNREYIFNRNDDHVSDDRWSSDQYYRKNNSLGLVNINFVLGIFSEERSKAIPAYCEFMDANKLEIPADFERYHYLKTDSLFSMNMLYNINNESIRNDRDFLSKVGEDMTNEAFQQIVLEKLGQLETGLHGVKSELSEVRGELSEVKNDVAGIKTELGEIKTKLEVGYEQTAILTEFKTDTAQQFAEIIETLSFVLHKEIENERELYVLKMKQVK